MPRATHPALVDLERVPGHPSVPRDPAEPEYWRQFLGRDDDEDVEFLVPGDMSGPFERFGRLAERVRATWSTLKLPAQRFLIDEDPQLLEKIPNPTWELLGIELTDDGTDAFELTFQILEDPHTTWAVQFEGDSPVGHAFW